MKIYHENNKNKRKTRYKSTRNPNASRRGSNEHRIRMSCSKQGINREDWGGFIRNQPYCSKFNESCRELNRDKYNRCCFICNKSEKENGRKLSVHHVDMNKQQGCDGDWCLVPLCSSCHGKAHSDPLQSRIQYLVKITKN